MGDRPVGDTTIVLTCLSCGADLERVATGRILAGRSASVILGCTECWREWHLQVCLAPLHDNVNLAPAAPPVKVAQCGTASGFAKHKRERTPVCDPCRLAHNADNRKWDAAKRSGVESRRVPCEAPA